MLFKFVFKPLIQLKVFSAWCQSSKVNYKHKWRSIQKHGQGLKENQQIILPLMQEKSKKL